ncbi:MAG: hypothetical protein NC253_04895 [Ruminococcus sp.]|nr:hypothetical protein [Ruminococcus sp.]MCM1382697.1 hypothetical protein [Muribaculaceae bacterium]MCM1478555.1 hypothetical protein [Muribaculaceae bacterium]
MIPQNVITASLIGVVITGLVPIIGGIALMAMGKIKASSFWAGVLAYIIAIIAAALLTAVAVLFVPNLAEESAAYGIITSAVTGAALALSMGVCVKSCMKTRTFKAAVSCGLGFGAAYAVTYAIGCVSMYVTFGTINSGAYDNQITATLRMLKSSGMSEADIEEMKSQLLAAKELFTSCTAGQIAQEILTVIFLAAALTAAAVFIMRFVCLGKAAAGFGAAMGTLILFSAASAIPNAVAAVTVSAAVGIAALIFALRMREEIVPPKKETAADPFMTSVENAKDNYN